jgi:hypothetical protein
MANPIAPSLTDPGGIQSLDDAKIWMRQVYDMANALGFSGASEKPVVPSGLPAPGARGEWDLLDVQTLSGVASKTITFRDYANYTDFADIEIGIRRLVPVTDDVGVRFILNADGGGNYSYASTYRDSSGTTVVGIFESGSAFIDISHYTSANAGAGNAVGETFQADILLSDFQDTTKYKTVQFDSWGRWAAGAAQGLSGFGEWRNANAVSSITISVEGGGNFSCILSVSGRRGSP